MSTPQANARANTYTTSHDQAPFGDVLTGALAATASMDDIVHASSTKALPTPRVDLTRRKDGTWRARADSIHDAMTGATARLGRVEVISCEKVDRGVGPWRRSWYEATLRTIDDTLAIDETDPEQERQQILDALFPPTTPDPVDEHEDTPAPVEQPTVHADKPEEPEPAPHTDVPVGAARLSLAIVNAVSDPTPQEDPQLPPPPLRETYPQADLTGVDIAAALDHLGLDEHLIAAVIDIGGTDDTHTALDLVVTDALESAGHLDERGGALTCGVGPRGAAALVNAAAAGHPIGYMQWGPDQGPATAPRLVAALLAGIRPH